VTVGATGGAGGAGGDAAGGGDGGAGVRSPFGSDAPEKYARQCSSTDDGFSR
jgi:hypothetical protein